MNVQDLLRTVEAVRSRSKDGQEGTVLEAACWFVACHEARGVFESYSVKDLAHAFVNGESLAGPYRTEADLDRWMHSAYEDGEDGAWDWLGEALNRHFGIREEAK